MDRSITGRRRVAAGALALAGALAAAAPAQAHGGGNGDGNGNGNYPGRGAVFVLSNVADGNAVLAFARGADGALSPAGSYPTGGRGTGAALGSQGALALDGDLLAAVDAGSDDVALFRVHGTRLELLDRAPSGGTMPISVALRDGVVEVLDAGGAGGIAGFRVGRDGHLHELAGGRQPLSGASVGPAEVAIAPDGRHAVVTEKATGLLDVYRLDGRGAAGPPTSTAGAGMTPYGFAFTRRGTLVVSEAAGGAAGATTVSSYRLHHGGLDVRTAADRSGQTAACWVASARRGRLAYVSNTGSDSITGYRVHRDGRLERLAADGVSASTGTGSHPLDLVASGDGRSLYALDAGTQRLGAFAIGDDGGLAALPGTGPALPAGAAGLVAG